MSKETRWLVKKTCWLVTGGLAIVLGAIYLVSFFLGRYEQAQSIPTKEPISTHHVTCTTNGHTRTTEIDVVEIDGVEYLVARTNNGVSICRK